MDLMDMAQLLGNFGEFFGAIAVVVTLIYVGYQIRQNTQSIERTELRAGMEQFDRWRAAIQNPETAEMWLRGLEDELTNRSERLRFEHLLAQYSYAMQNTWDCSQRGIRDMDDWNRVAPYFGGIFATPGGARFWKKVRAHYPLGFVSALEDSHADKVP